MIRIFLMIFKSLKGDINYYNVLGVHQKASNYELRKAFCKLSIELHPDTTSLDLEDAKKKFQIVLEAYENLNNANLRKIYDEKLKANCLKSSKINKNIISPFVVDNYNNNSNFVGNRRPFSNGEMFSLFFLIVIIVISLIFSILIASFTGREIDTIPVWLIR